MPGLVESVGGDARSGCPGPAGHLETARADGPGMVGRRHHEPPRRRPTLEWTLDSLARAGWKQARLFVDSAVTLPGRYADYPVTYREPKLGIWPNFYLGLTELVMRDPHADAYLMVQDDVIFHDREDLAPPRNDPVEPTAAGPISLYCSGVMARPECGWFRHAEPWFLGANALIFSPRAAHEFLTDPEVLAHRSSGATTAWRTSTPWSASGPRQGTPMLVPSPSLCRHTGQTSALWPSASLEGTRKTGPFAGELHATDRLLDSERAAFPESAFPCAAEFRQEYARRVGRGRDRMRGSSVVICGLCRDVRPWLPPRPRTSSGWARCSASTRSSAWKPIPPMRPSASSKPGPNRTAPSTSSKATRGWLFRPAWDGSVRTDLRTSPGR